MGNGRVGFRDRARGALAGVAIGNLLGIRQEGWSRELIAERCPDGVREIEASCGWPDDDDVAQTIVVAEATADGPLQVDDLARRLWRWGEINGAGMGGLTRAALAGFGGDRPLQLARNRKWGRAREPEGTTAAEASRQAWSGSRAGNGALMRCAPVALRWAREPERIVRESVVSAVPTHWDPRCGWSCALANLAIAAALRGEKLDGRELLERARAGVRRDLAELRQYGYTAEEPESVKKAVEAASSMRSGELVADIETMGYTLLTLKACLIAWWDADDAEEALRAIVESGGDTDTNGAVVGAIAGARFGLGGLPREWREHVAEIRDGRVPMERYADRILEAAGEG